MRGRAATALALFLALAYGCGNGHEPPVSSPLRLEVQWAERGRAVGAPSSALSVVVRLARIAREEHDPEFTFNRQRGPEAHSQLYVSPTPVVTGWRRITARFFAEPNGSGELVGTAAANAIVAADGTLTTPISAQSRIASFAVLAGQEVRTGRPTDVLIEARDASGALIALPRSAAVLSVRNGSGSARVVRGRLLGLSDGEVTVTAALDGRTNTAAVKVRYLGMSRGRWPHFRGDAQNSGQSDGVVTEGRIANFFGTSAYYSGVSPITGAGSTVIYGVQHPGGGSLVAEDTRTLSPLWARRGPTRSVTGEDGTVYTIGRMARQLHILALDGATGEERWGLNLGRSPFSLVLAPDGTLYVSGDTALYAVDVVERAVRWSREGYGMVQPAVGEDGTIFVAPVGGALCALDPTDGTELWRAPLGSTISTLACIGPDSTVYVGSDSAVRAFDAATGAVPWTKPAAATIGSLAVSRDGTVYAPVDSSLMAFDGATGTVLWRYEQGGATDGVCIGGDGTVYGAQLRRAWAVSGRTGRLLWEVALAPGPNPANVMIGPPALDSDGTLYVMNTSGIYVVR